MSPTCRQHYQPSPSLRPSSPSDEGGISVLRGFRSRLRESAPNDDDASACDASDDASADDASADDASDDASTGDASSDNDSSAEDDASEGTIVPGTQLPILGGMLPTPYNNLTASRRREALGCEVADSDVDGVDPDHEKIIRQVMLDDWGIRHPREFQIRAVASLAFQRDRLLFLIAKTGSGKSAVPLAVGALQSGITLTMVPLVGLGSDQVSKSTNEANFIEAYHLDEHMGTDAQVLKNRLLSLNTREAEFVSIFLYASPQSLQPGTLWHKLLVTLSSRDLIRLIVVDEAHSVALDGRDFRPEFRTAMKTLKSLYDNQPTRCNRLVMSATFRKCDQDIISDLYKCPPDETIWLELSRRQIVFDVNVCGKPSLSISSSVSQDLKDPTDLKVIVYTNSKQQALGSITDSMEGVLEKRKINGEVIPMTGDDGIQFKVWVMHAFANDICADGDEDNGQDTPHLPLLRIMPATKAADCGVSSQQCRRSYRNGLPSNMHTVVQEMGRVDRNPLAEPGDNRYEVHISFGCVVKIYARIMQHPLESERRTQITSMLEVLTFLVCPSDCQHILMERYFEDESSGRLYEECRTMCSKCNQGMNPLTGRVHRTRAANLLVGFFSGKKHAWPELLRYVKLRSKDIFPDDDKFKYVGPIHAFCMQLIAKGIVRLRISDHKKYLIGKQELSPTAVTVELTMTNGEPCALIERYWEGMRLADRDN